MFSWSIGGGLICLNHAPKPLVPSLLMIEFSLNVDLLIFFLGFVVDTVGAFYKVRRLICRISLSWIR